jgi:predicted ATPase
LGRQVVKAYHSLAALYEGQGAYEQALAHARRRVELEPWQEEGQRQLMRLLARSGHRSEALAQYEKLCRSLQEELGAEPSEETSALCEAIRSGKLAPETALRPGPPVPVWNLPASATPFFGRASELATLETKLAEPDTRLVTLTGLGGSGKTRLALEVGSRLAERERQALADQSPLTFPHGIVFIPLAALDSVEGLAPALADALRLRLKGGQEQLLEFLRRKQLLLILMATSRERLLVQGEHVLPLGGLPYPEHDLRHTLPGAVDRDTWPQGAVGACLAAYPALQLLAEGVRRVRPRFSPSTRDLPVMLDICRLVDGLPLALELAASWADALSLNDILAEARRSLDFWRVDWPDLPERQRSIRAVFDVSWRRLNPAEQSMFASLTVFRGGLTREAAGQMAAGAETTLRLLAALVRKSFLQYDQARDRYGIHELLRQYGAEKLARDPALEAAARDQHSQYYCDWPSQGEEGLTGAERQAVWDAIQDDTENVRVACLWAATQGRPSRLGRAVDALGWFYYLG